MTLERKPKDELRVRLEAAFASRGVVAYWDSVADPDDRSPIEVLRVLNVPTNDVVEVDRAAYDAAYELWGFDWDFLIDVRDQSEVQAAGCYAAIYRHLVHERAVAKKSATADLGGFYSSELAGLVYSRHVLSIDEDSPGVRFVGDWVDLLTQQDDTGYFVVGSAMKRGIGKSQPSAHDYHRQISLGSDVVDVVQQALTIHSTELVSGVDLDAFNNWVRSDLLAQSTITFSGLASTQAVTMANTHSLAA